MAWKPSEVLPVHVANHSSNLVAALRHRAHRTSVLALAAVQEAQEAAKVYSSCPSSHASGRRKAVPRLGGPQEKQTDEEKPRGLEAPTG